MSQSNEVEDEMGIIRDLDSQISALQEKVDSLRERMNKPDTSEKERTASGIKWDEAITELGKLLQRQSQQWTSARDELRTESTSTWPPESRPLTEEERKDLKDSAEVAISVEESRQRIAGALNVPQLTGATHFSPDLYTPDCTPVDMSDPSSRASASKVATDLSDTSKRQAERAEHNAVHAMLSRHSGDLESYVLHQGQADRQATASGKLWNKFMEQAKTSMAPTDTGSSNTQTQHRDAPSEGQSHEEGN